jgi:hypothetical protein
MGLPFAGERRLLTDIIKTLASICASKDKGHMDSHLVSIKVGIKGSTDKGMESYSLALYKHRVKCLNTEPVQSRCPV